MYIEGWAFKEDEDERRKAKDARYAEIKDTPGVKFSVTPAYKEGLFSGTLETDEARALSEADLALIADRGNLCFGGHCTKRGDGFSGAYYTD